MSQSDIETDPESISRGKELFKAYCRTCHSISSTETTTGPGLAGILGREKLPVSGRPATAEHVEKQLKEPFNRMPSFSYLSDEEIDDIIAYLDTL